MECVLNKVQQRQWPSLLATNSRKDNATVIGQEPSGGVKEKGHSNAKHHFIKQRQPDHEQSRDCGAYGQGTSQRNG